LRETVVSFWGEKGWSECGSFGGVYVLYVLGMRREEWVKVCEFNLGCDENISAIILVQ
jgi:hypothetical protein